MRLETKLAKMGALGVLVAIDYRDTKQPDCEDRAKKITRMEHVLGAILGMAETDAAIHGVVAPQLQQLGKLFGFDLIDEAMISHPGNEETH